MQNLAARPSRPASDLCSKYRAFESDFCDPLAMAASNLFPFPIEVEYSPLADESMTLNCRLTEMRRSSDRRSQTLISYHRAGEPRASNNAIVSQSHTCLGRDRERIHFDSTGGHWTTNRTRRGRGRGQAGGRGGPTGAFWVSGSAVSESRCQIRQ